MTRVLVPSGALGLDYDRTALARGVANNPDLIAIDGGSTDSGPYYLGTGTSKYARASTKVEWKGLIEAAREAGCPLVIGTAGTCGTDSTVDWLLDITKECLAELGMSAKIATLKSQQDPAGLLKAFDKIFPLPGAPEATPDTIAQCTNIVALAGAEQIQAALETGADIVIAGRTTDTAIIAALPLMRGDHAGGAWHGAKIGECGALCATNPQSGVVQIDFDATGFVVSPMAEDSVATPHTVSAHMLYENSDPFLLHEPGGHLDVRQATYTGHSERSVRVEGGQWHPAKDYSVKLEGVRIAGFQTVALVTIRDPEYVGKVDRWCDEIKDLHRDKVAKRMGLDSSEYSLELRVIGKDATLGTLETVNGTPCEVGVIGIVTAEDQATANEIAKFLNPYLLHYPLTREEEVPTFAFPFSPAEIDRGPAYEFVLHHTLRLAEPMDAFRLEVFDA